MNNILKSFLLVQIALISFLIYGCHQSEISGLNTGEKTELKKKSSRNFVSKQLAVSVAEDFANKYNFRFKNLLNRKVVKNKNTTEKEVEKVWPLKDKNGNIALYLINYKKSGFAIIPADQRENPILAYSEIKKNIQYQR